MPKGYVTLQGCTCKVDTESAILIVYEGEEFWLPKSQLHDDSECYEKDTSGTVVIPEWLGKKKGLWEG